MNTTEVQEIRDAQEQQKPPMTNKVRDIHVTNNLSMAQDKSTTFDAENKTVVFVPFFDPQLTRPESSESEEYSSDYSINEETGEYRKDGSRRHRQDFGSSFGGGHKDGGSRRRSKIENYVPPSGASAYRDINGYSRSNRSKNKKPKLEVTTTKPIEIRMVGIGKKISEEITEIERRETTGTTQVSKNSVSVEELWEAGFAGGRGSRSQASDTDMNKPSSELSQKIFITDEAVKTRRTVRSYSIRPLSIQLRGDQVLGADQFERDLQKEYSPSKKAQLQDTWENLVVDNVTVTSLDFRLSKLG